MKILTSLSRMLGFGAHKEVMRSLSHSTQRIRNAGETMQRMEDLHALNESGLGQFSEVLIKLEKAGLSKGKK